MKNRFAVLFAIGMLSITSCVPAVAYDVGPSIHYAPSKLKCNAITAPIILVTCDNADFPVIINPDHIQAAATHEVASLRTTAITELKASTVIAGNQYKRSHYRGTHSITCNALHIDPGLTT